MITAGELLARCLGINGIDVVYGRPWPGLAVLAVEDPAVAALLAAAHWRVHDAAAAVHLGDGRLSLGAPAAGPELSVCKPGELLEAFASLSGRPAVLRLDLDLAAPAPDAVPQQRPPRSRWTEPDPDHVKRLDAARSPVVLAGPGVVHDRAAPGLNALAAAGSLGVLNTWGAKGVLDWRSRHHWATVGLQERDFDLGGVPGSDLIVATGVDADEAPVERWRLAPVLDAPPSSLVPLAEQLSRPRAELTMPPLRRALATITQRGWQAEHAPLAPTRVTLHYGRCVEGGGLVAADPGVGGYWVARTLATTEVGAVQVPADPHARGLAPACALVARLHRRSRPVLAVVDGPLNPAVRAVLAVAERLGVGIPMEVWDPSGPALAADDHLERLGRLLVAGRPRPVALATDDDQLGQMLDVAGPVVAWAGLHRTTP